MAALRPDLSTAAGSPAPAVAAAVLCGGASRRLGVDKAAQSVGGVPLALVVARIARAAGAATVFGVGARPEVASALAADGIDVVPDRWPGAGPAGGVVTALGATACDLLVVVGCDHPWLRPDSLATLIDVLVADDGWAAVVAEADGRLHPTVGVWRVSACAAATTYFADGGRSLHGLVDCVGARSVAVAAGEVRDVDTPGDLAAAREGLPPVTIRDTATAPGGSTTTPDRTR